MTIEDDEELSSEKLDFICSFLHRSLYRSLIHEDFFKFYNVLNFKYPLVDVNKNRNNILTEIVLRNNEIKSIVEPEIKDSKSIWDCVIY